jgi:hypothetical protein
MKTIAFTICLLLLVGLSSCSSSSTAQNAGRPCTLQSVCQDVGTLQGQVAALQGQVAALNQAQLKFDTRGQNQDIGLTFVGNKSALLFDYKNASPSATQLVLVTVTDILGGTNPSTNFGTQIVVVPGENMTLGLGKLGSAVFSIQGTALMYSGGYPTHVQLSAIYK